MPGNALLLLRLLQRSGLVAIDGGQNLQHTFGLGVCRAVGYEGHPADTRVIGRDDLLLLGEQCFVIGRCRLYEDKFGLLRVLLPGFEELGDVFLERRLVVPPQP